MARAPVGPRAGKEEFMRALSLTPGDAHCEGIYRSMREVAIQVYMQINSDRSNLKAEQKDDLSVTTPFFWHHIREECRDAAVRRTWQNAPHDSVTRRYFDLGQTAGDHAPNWVTLWLLYSVFRSRDIRNNRSRRAGEGSDAGTAPVTKPVDRLTYDPVRDSLLT